MSFRSNNSDNNSNWTKVNVGLPDPDDAISSGRRRKSTNHYDDDDDDGSNNNKNNNNNSNERAAQRDLEASPKEAVGMFYSLEVLDGSQYDVITHNNARIFREKNNHDNKRKKKRKAAASTNEDDDDDDDDDDKNGTSVDSNDINNNNIKTKTKKKKRKKRRITTTEAKNDGDDENASANDRSTTETKKPPLSSSSLSGSISSVAQSTATPAFGEKDDDKNKTTSSVETSTSSIPSSNTTTTTGTRNKKKSNNNNNKKSSSNNKKSSKKKNAKQPEKDNDGGSNTTTGSGVEEAATSHDPKDGTIGDNDAVASLQQSWMVATGGVLLDTRLCASMVMLGFQRPTPIQAATLAAAMLGRRNIVGAAPTGSGKTLAYLLPILQTLLQQQQQESSLSVQALILTPTRELTLQVAQEAKKLLSTAATTSNGGHGGGGGDGGINVATLVGGLALPKQVRILKTRHPPIVVATPGRLWEMIESRDHAHLNNLTQIRYLVIDEADRMVQQGSFPQLTKILEKVHDANPLGDEDDDGDEEVEEDIVGGGGDDGGRLLGLPGVPGEARVVMLDDVLERMRKQQQEDLGPPEPAELDDDEYNEQMQRSVLHHHADDSNDDNGNDELELPFAIPPPVQRQTFIYSATLTLPPSESYTPPIGRKRKNTKRQMNLSVEGALAEMLDKAHAHGPTKVVDLTTTTKKKAKNDIIDASATTFSPATMSTTNGSSKLPPGLSLWKIECTQKHKDSHLYSYLVTAAADGPCLIFCNSIAAVRRVGRTLQTLRLPVVRMLHANMQQKARLKAVESLRSSNSRSIVVATDVAARGLDIPSVATVIHYDVARAADTFIHRAGRTARGVGEGAVGASVSLVAPSEDKAHERICATLDSKCLFQTVPLDGRLLSEVQERVHLASKIVECENTETKVHKQNKWFQEAAKEAGLDLDQDLLEHGLAGGNIRERQQLHQAKRAQADLRVLLSQPMTTQRFGKFFLTAHRHNSSHRLPNIIAPAISGEQKRSKKYKRQRRRR